MMARSDGSRHGNNQDAFMEPARGAKRAMTRVAAAVKWRQNAKYDEIWTRLIKLYGNKYEYPELDGYEDVVAPNMLFSTVNVIVPGVSVNYPKISVTARQEVNDVRSATVEAMANYTWQHGDVHEEFRKAVKDFVVVGHGWCKTTWSFVEAETEWTDQEFQTAVMEQLFELEQKIIQARNAGLPTDGFPSADDIVASIPEMRTYVKEDRPIVERISPFDMFVDPDATDIKHARWIAQRMYIPIEKARVREDWSPKARKALKPTAMSEAKSELDDLLFEGEERGTDTEFAVIWEYYDLVTDEVCVFADGASDYLDAPEPVPFAFPHPFVMMCNYQIPDKLYPLGDVEAIAPLQMEMALTRTQMINDRKAGRRMYMYRPDKIGAEGVQALLGTEDNAMISIESDDPFGELIAPISTTMLAPEFYNQSAMILEDINLVSGVSEYARGATTEIRRTATEANMIQDGANARSADKLAIIERSIGEIAGRCVSLAQQFLTTEGVARVVGEDNAMTWVQYTKEDLQGEWDFNIEAGSTMPQNESSRRQSAMQLMDALAPFMSMGVINPLALADHVMRMGFGIKDTSKFLIQPMIDPMTGQPVPPGMEPGMSGPEGAPPAPGPQ